MGCLLYWTRVDTHGYVDGDVYIDRLCLLGRYGVSFTAVFVFAVGYV